jgi:hypothetical protein
MTFTGLIGFIFNFPLRAIIWTCVRLRISPNVLTFTGVVINVIAAWELAHARLLSAGSDGRRQRLRLHRRQGGRTGHGDRSAPSSTR